MCLTRHILFLLRKSMQTTLICPLACVHNKMVCLIDDFIFRTRCSKSLNYANILLNYCFKTQVKFAYYCFKTQVYPLY